MGYGRLFTTDVYYEPLFSFRREMVDCISWRRIVIMHEPLTKFSSFCIDIVLFGPPILSLQRVQFGGKFEKNCRDLVRMSLTGIRIQGRVVRGIDCRVLGLGKDTRIVYLLLGFYVLWPSYFNSIEL